MVECPSLVTYKSPKKGYLLQVHLCENVKALL